MALNKFWGFSLTNTAIIQKIGLGLTVNDKGMILQASVTTECRVNAFLSEKICGLVLTNI